MNSAFGGVFRKKDFINIFQIIEESVDRVLYSMYTL